MVCDRTLGGGSLRLALLPRQPDRRPRVTARVSHRSSGDADRCPRITHRRTSGTAPGLTPAPPPQWNECPQAQLPCAIGLSLGNPDCFNVSTKSKVALRGY